MAFPITERSIGTATAMRWTNEEIHGMKTHWDERYMGGDLPWDTGRHDRALERTITEHDIFYAQTRGLLTEHSDGTTTATRGEVCNSH